MHFDIFKRRTDAHVRSVRQYLQEANLARIEHQVAAEHHAALAAMYTQRVNWLEQEMTNPRAPWSVQPAPASKQVPAAASARRSGVPRVLREGRRFMLKIPRCGVCDGLNERNALSLAASASRLRHADAAGRSRFRGGCQQTNTPIDQKAPGRRGRGPGPQGGPVNGLCSAGVQGVVRVSPCTAL